jgi:hypothetical protein
MKSKNYIHRFPFYQRPFYKLTVFIQWLLWELNINWHNSFFDECTPDFSCCIHKYPIGSEERYILGQIAKSAKDGDCIVKFDKDIR